ncbi:MAG: hypothetical protein COB15_04805 [Flavobacteriales bacterium]|nr:MAG: hypothetical protein COB15_04805 [Flavobacteriales bacterium]
MSSQLKKYIFIILLIGASCGGYWWFYSSHWGVSITKEHLWEYSFQQKGKESFDDVIWEKPQEVKPFPEDRSNLNLVFRTRFTLKDFSKVVEGSLEYGFRYSAKVLINGTECSYTNRNLITPSLENDKLKIEEYWRPRKVTINQEVLAELLKNGENTITIIVYNLEDLKTIDCSKKQLAFLTEGNSNNLESNYKIKKPSSYFSESNIPIFKINTNDSVIPDEPKIEASLNIVNIPSRTNKLSGPYVFHNIKIERRGNTSQTFAKKSYSINLCDSNYKKKSRSLLGLPDSKKWVLYGPYADKSLIRNSLTYSIYRQMGNYAPRTRFIDLVINDNYRGIYVLTEKIQLGSNHLDIPSFKMGLKDSSKASGGYLLEIDRNLWRGAYPPPNDTSSIPSSYMVKEPKRSQISPEIEKTIKRQYNTFEKHLYENDSIYNYLDINSFVDYLIITEFTKNIDGYCLSTFLYNKEISSPTPKYYLGPIWDYNFSLGLTDYREGFNPEGYVYNSTKYIPFWWKTLLKDETYNNALKKRYFELRKGVLSNRNIENSIDSLHTILKNANVLNFKKWPVLNSPDFWPNYFLGKTYLDEIAYLKSWINKRLNFLDNDILAKEKKGLKYYEISIRNNKKWMREIKIKAKKREISVDEMIKIDAKYMVKVF